MKAEVQVIFRVGLHHLLAMTISLGGQQVGTATWQTLAVAHSRKRGQSWQITNLKHGGDPVNQHSLRSKRALGITGT